MVEKDENLSKLLERNWLHCQHVENERSQFMQVYAAIIAGVLVGYFYLLTTEKFFNDKSLFYLVTIGLLFFLALLTFLALFLTLRWIHTFECHRQRVNALARILNPDKTIDLSMTIPSMHLLCFGGAFKTKYVFPSFYFVLLVVLCVLEGFVLFNFLNFEGILTWFAVIIALTVFVLPVLLALNIVHGGFKSIKEIDTQKHVVVLVGCNGEWAQQNYLPFLLRKAKKGEIILWATDVQTEIKLDYPHIDRLWRTVESKNQAFYLDMTPHYEDVKKGIESEETPRNIDYVFVVTPDLTHCEVAEFWLNRLSPSGRIFIEKPLDISIRVAEVLKAKNQNRNTVYGFDHYLVRISPFLKRIYSHLRKIGVLQTLEIKILESSDIPQYKERTLEQGVIFDLFCHALVVAATVVIKKLSPTIAILQKVRVTEVEGAKYRGWHFASETWARIKFTIDGKEVNSRIGKGVGKKPDKYMTVFGKNNKRIVFKFKNGLEPKTVETFLEAVLKGNKIDSIPGVLSFETAFRVLELLCEAKSKITMRPTDYDIGMYP